MMGIDGHVLVRVQKVRCHQHITAAPDAALTCCHLPADRPKHAHQSPSSPSFPLNPPRRSSPALAWLVHEAETVDDPALVGPAPKPEPRDVDLCVADRAGCRADGSIELGTHRFEGWIVAPPDCIFVALSTMTVSGTSLPAPTPWSSAQARSTSPSSSRSGSSARISSIVSSGSALPSHTSADRTVSDQASNDASRGNIQDGRPRCRPGRSSDMRQYTCRDRRGWT